MILSLKQLAKELANPVLSRIAEVVLLAINKLELVKSQISQFQVSYKSQQRVSTSPSLYIKTLEGGEWSNMPRSSDQVAGGNPFQTAWEKWCNANMDQVKRFLLILLTRMNMLALSGKILIQLLWLTSIVGHEMKWSSFFRNGMLGQKPKNCYTEIMLPGMN